MFCVCFVLLGTAGSSKIRGFKGKEDKKILLQKVAGLVSGLACWLALLFVSHFRVGWNLVWQVPGNS